MRIKEKPTEGILLIDKPSGWTSHDAVAVLRRALKIKKIGHSGTLDPMATGLLVALIGKATKSQAEFQKFPKTYSGTIYFGTETDTWDAEGKVVKECPLSEELTAAKVKAAALKMQGHITQMIPAYSAAKHNGQPLYKLARSGQEVIKKEKKVFIYKWSELKWEKPCLEFTVECSSGTYVRSIAYELGLQFGCGAHLKKLRRSKVNGFSVSDAVSAEQLKTLKREDVIKKILPL